MRKRDNTGPRDDFAKKIDGILNKPEKENVMLKVDSKLLHMGRVHLKGKLGAIFEAALEEALRKAGKV